MSRERTIELLEAMDEGTIDPKYLVECCLRAMSEQNVREMIQQECLLDYSDDEDEFVDRARGDDGEEEDEE